MDQPYVGIKINHYYVQVAWKGIEVTPNIACHFYEYILFFNGLKHNHGRWSQPLCIPLIILVSYGIIGSMHELHAYIRSYIIVIGWNIKGHGAKVMSACI
jgi:hypothetical protein